MEQYIKKSALVAELENRIKELRNIHKENEEKLDSIQKTAILLCIDECKVILSILDTLEVEEVENTELLKVRGYLVRDKDDYTAIYVEKPHRGKTEWVNDSYLMTINDARLVPDIEFEDEPVEVEVTLKRLKAKGE